MVKKAAATAGQDEELAQNATLPEAEFTPDDVAIMRIMEEIGGDEQAKVRIYRQGKTYQDLTLIHECSPMEFEPMMLAHPPYNGGEFRIHAVTKAGFAGNRLLKVAPAADAVTPGQTAAVTVVGSNDNSAVLVQMLTAMQANTEKLITALKPATPIDPMQTLDGIAKIAAMFKPEPVVIPQQRDSFMETMKAVEQFMGMTERMKTPSVTDSEGELSMPGVISMAVRELRNLRQPTPVPAGQAQQGQVAVIPNQQEKTVIEPSAEDQELNIVVKFQLKQANKAAEKLVNPAEYAEEIYSMIPDEALQMIASDAEWFAIFSSLVPECAKHAEWYKAVREQIILIMKEEGLLQTPTEPVKTPVDEIKTGVIDDTANAGTSIKG